MNSVGNIGLTSASTEEQRALFKLHRAAFRAHIERIWGWDEAWQESQFASECASSSTSIVRLSGRIVGYIQVDYEPHRVYLRNIALQSEFQNQGIGAAILNGLKAEVTALHVPLELRVFKTNESALRFYERLGFIRISESVTHAELQWRGA